MPSHSPISLSPSEACGNIATVLEAGKQGFGNLGALAIVHGTQLQLSARQQAPKLCARGVKRQGSPLQIGCLIRKSCQVLHQFLGSECVQHCHPLTQIPHVSERCALKDLKAVRRIMQPLRAFAPGYLTDPVRTRISLLLQEAQLSRTECSRLAKDLHQASKLGSQANTAAVEESWRRLRLLSQRCYLSDSFQVHQLFERSIPQHPIATRQLGELALRLASFGGRGGQEGPILNRDVLRQRLKEWSGLDLDTSANFDVLAGLIEFIHAAWQFKCLPDFAEGLELLKTVSLSHLSDLIQALPKAKALILGPSFSRLVPSLSYIMDRIACSPSSLLRRLVHLEALLEQIEAQCYSACYAVPGKVLLHILQMQGYLSLELGDPALQRCLFLLQDYTDSFPAGEQELRLPKSYLFHGSATEAWAKESCQQGLGQQYLPELHDCWLYGRFLSYYALDHAEGSQQELGKALQAGAIYLLDPAGFESIPLNGESTAELAPGQWYPLPQLPRARASDMEQAVLRYLCLALHKHPSLKGRRRQRGAPKPAHG